MDLLNRIRDLCQKNNTSIYKIERELCFSNGSISRWGTIDPSATKVLKVAQHFGVSVDFLLTGDAQALKARKQTDLVGE